MRRFVFFILGLAAGLLSGYFVSRSRCEFAMPVIHFQTDTVRVILPPVREVRRVDDRICRMAVAVRGGAKEMSDSAVAGESAGSESCVDSADVIVPFEQVEYAGEGYRAYVSGYRPVLDSLVMVREVPVVKLPSRRESCRRFSVGIQAGYGLTPAGVQPYIGVGVSLRLF